jgi:hypothetical protein
MYKVIKNSLYKNNQNYLQLRNNIKMSVKLKKSVQY